MVGGGTITGAETAILTLLAEQPRHGYELEQVIADRGMREWTEIGFSSIYYVLKKLEARGWVQGRADAGRTRGPARTVYHATSAGRTALHGATIAALSEPEPARRQLLLGLANLPGLAPAEARQALSQYRRRLAERRAHVHSRRDRAGPGAPYFVTALFDLSLTLMDAELHWLDAFLAQIHEQGGTDRGPTDRGRQGPLHRPD